MKNILSSYSDITVIHKKMVKLHSHKKATYSRKQGDTWKKNSIRYIAFINLYDGFNKIREPTLFLDNSTTDIFCKLLAHEIRKNVKCQD
jgi:hypothetical protein